MSLNYKIIDKRQQLMQQTIQVLCNDPRKSASHICVIPQKDQLQLRLLVVVNKAQFNPVNTRCGTHYTPPLITQSIKLGYPNLPHLNPSRPRQGPLCGVVSLSPHGITRSALIPYVKHQPHLRYTSKGLVTIEAPCNC